MPTGRRRLASSLRAAEPSSPNEAKALSNNPADNNLVATETETIPPKQLGHDGEGPAQVAGSATGERSLSE
jgi:hypothetical protein